MNVSVSGLCEEILRPVLFRIDSALFTPRTNEAVAPAPVSQRLANRSGGHSSLLLIFPIAGAGIILGGQSWSGTCVATNYCSLGYSADSAHRAWGEGETKICVIIAINHHKRDVYMCAVTAELTVMMLRHKNIEGIILIIFTRMVISIFSKRPGTSG